MTEYTIVALAAVYFLAGTVKGTFGVGFPTAAIALSAVLRNHVPLVMKGSLT